MCREVWFPPPHNARTFLNEQIGVIRNLVERSEHAHAQMQRIIEELAPQFVMDMVKLEEAQTILQSMTAQIEELRRLVEAVETVLRTNRYI
jgi:vacuolar-type H+-ATPase subunit D/Vma8